MIISLEDSGTDKLNEILEENEKVISNYKEKYKKLLKKQEEILAESINKVAPVLNFLMKRNYRFIHPSLNFNSPQGPILDFKENFLYIWDVRSHVVRKINIHNQDDKGFFTLDEFVSFCNFENAINGILYCLKLQNVIIAEYQKEIDEREKIIGQYEDSLLYK